MHFHLMYHLWPLKQTDRWQWSLRQLKKRWRIFDGQRLLSVATGPDTVGFREVVAYCESIGLDWTRLNNETNNPKRGETVSWPWFLATLKPSQLPQDDLVCYAHGKSAKYSAESSTVIWADVLYQATFDYMPTVLELFRRGVPYAGSFKVNESMIEGVRHQFWYYSGTFFWFKPSLFSNTAWKKVRPKYHGVEFWPNECFPFERCGDIFTPDIGSNPGQTAFLGYSADHWQKYYLPAFNQWKKDNAHNRIIW